MIYIDKNYHNDETILVQICYLRPSKLKWILIKKKKKIIL
jgi:hypothetical protein